MLRENTWYAKLSKCEFLKTSIHYLGHVISSKGVEMDQSKVNAIVRWPAPKTMEYLRIFLGMAGFYRKYIKDFSKISVSMTDQLEGMRKFFWWGDEQQCSFEKLKVALAMAPILAIVDPHKPFVLETNASAKAVGAVLLQDGRPIAFESKKLSRA